MMMMMMMMMTMFVIVLSHIELCLCLYVGLVAFRTSRLSYLNVLFEGNTHSRDKSGDVQSVTGLWQSSGKDNGRSQSMNCVLHYIS